MERSERAKQFMPFDALTGLRKKLAAVEERRSRVEKAVLDEETTKAISDTLLKLSVGSAVEACIYKNGHYVTVIGEVTKISNAYKFLEINYNKIFFDDIYSISLTLKL